MAGVVTEAGNGQTPGIPYLLVQPRPSFVPRREHFIELTLFPSFGALRGGAVNPESRESKGQARGHPICRDWNTPCRCVGTGWIRGLGKCSYCVREEKVGSEDEIRPRELRLGISWKISIVTQNRF
eukprot:1395512-Amorphochlora_amoeboformis.AAC.2